jgi:hypothetical protein
MNLTSKISSIFNKNYHQFLRSQKPDGTVDAHVARHDDRTVVTVGDHSFFVRVLGAPQPDQSLADFAIFGLAIISMSANLHIRLTSAVSADAVQTIADLAYAIKIWTLPGVAPLRLDCLNVVPTPLPAERKGRILCLSGGVDSTAAAIIARDRGYTHGLLIAGADYSHADHPGFQDLSARVRAAAEILGLELIQIETNLRKLPFKWEMLHSLNLGSCLHYVAPLFAGGAFALDNTIVQDLARHPWGNSSPLAEMFGTPAFPIERLGGHLDRVQKLKSIAAQAPDVLPHLSVCWKDTSTGGNCGVCEKCVRTRLAFVCAGVDDAATFPNHPPIADLVKNFVLPKRYTLLRGLHLRVSEVMRYLPEGDLRDILLKQEDEIRKQIVLLQPMK